MIKENSKYKLDLKVAEFVNSVTCQIFIKGGSLDYNPLGSAVLSELEDDIFLITASHIAQYYKEGLFIFLGNGKLKEIKGSILFTNYNTEKKIDIAYIKLDIVLKKELKNVFNFLQSHSIQLSHEINSNDAYYVFGYPAKNIKKTKYKYLSTHATGHKLNPSQEKVYKYHKFDKKLFYILDFKGASIDMNTELKSKGNIEQNGLSGGGLWHIGKKKIGNNKFEINVSLVGIMTDQRRNKYNCLIANKIDSLIHAIAMFEKNSSAIELQKTSKDCYTFRQETNKTS